MTRLSQGAEFSNLSIAPAEKVRPHYFIVKDIFTTADGSWEVGGNVFSIPRWARDAYLRPVGATDYFDDAGASTHLFARVENARGEPLNMDILLVSSGGLSMRFNTFSDGKRSGWCNMFMNRDSAYNPHAGEVGPWSMSVDVLNSDTVKGLGLPFRWHVSTFVVFQRIAFDDTDKPPVDPPDGGDNRDELAERVAWLERDVTALKALMAQWTGDGR